MATIEPMKAVYHPEGDALWLEILPARPTHTSMTEYDFYIRHDTERPDEIVGFQILQFSLFVPHLHESGVVPDVSYRFDVVDTDLKGLRLKEVIEWAYWRYVLKLEEETIQQRARPLLAVHTA